jgi:hypothetical protein
MFAMSQFSALNPARADSAAAWNCLPESIGSHTGPRQNRLERVGLPASHNPFGYKGIMALNGGMGQTEIRYG